MLWLTSDKNNCFSLGCHSINYNSDTLEALTNFFLAQLNTYIIYHFCVIYVFSPSVSIVCALIRFLDSDMNFFIGRIKSVFTKAIKCYKVQPARQYEKPNKAVLAKRCRTPFTRPVLGRLYFQITFQIDWWTFENYCLVKNSRMKAFPVYSTTHWIGRQTSSRYIFPPVFYKLTKRHLCNTVQKATVNPHL